MAQKSGLTVRQHEREGIQVPVEFVIAPHHVGQVRFSPSSSAAAPNTIRAEAIDISSGGIGLRSRQFLPRNCEGVVRVMMPDGSVNPDGSHGMVVALEQRAKVRRVTMIGREPMYGLGVAFIDPDTGLDRRIGELLEQLHATRRPQPAGQGGAAHA